MLEFSKKGIGLVFGVVFLFLAVRNTNLDETLSIMKSIHLLPVLAIVFLKAFGLLVRGFRWSIVLEHVKRISPLTLFRISSVGEMGNYLLPARVGELFRIFLVSKRESLSKTSVLASVFLDRFLDMITVLTLFFLFSFFISVPAFMTRIGFLALLAVIVCIAGAWMLLAFDQRVERVIQRLFHSKPHLTNPCVPSAGPCPWESIDGILPP